MSGQRFKSVFDAIADTQEEAMNMKLRAHLIDTLRARIESEGWTQAEAADRLGVTQPRISDLRRGKMHLFSLDKLVNMLGALGQEVEITVKAA